jgi:hypothetical protein
MSTGRHGRGEHRSLASAEVTHGGATGNARAAERAGRRLCLALMLFLMMSGTTGCWLVFVDNFSGRAVAYNLEAEKSQDQGILLNIIRASKRRPMVFTGVQTVAGTASESAGFGLTWPGGDSGNTSRFVLNPGASVSAGPTFNVGVLDTQEFYNGMLRSLEPATFDRFFQEGYLKNLLLNLFIEKITIRQEDGSQRSWVIELSNDVDVPRKLARFQFTVEYLLYLGLTSEAISKDVGPLLSPKEASDVKALAKGEAAKLEPKQLEWCDLNPFDWREFISRQSSAAAKDLENSIDILNGICQQTSHGPLETRPDQANLFRKSFPDLPSVLYRMQTPDGDFQFCFDTADSVVDGEKHIINNPITKTSAACDVAKSETYEHSGDRREELTPRYPELSFKDIPLGPYLATGLSYTDKQFENSNNNSGRTVRSPSGCPNNGAQSYACIDFSKPVDLEFVPRSTEGVIYYLGEILRQEIDPDWYQPGDPASCLPRSTYSPHPNPPPRVHPCQPRVTYIRKEGPEGPGQRNPPSGYCVPGRVSSDRSSLCEPLFVLERDKQEPGLMYPMDSTSIVPNEPTPILTVSYDGDHYAVPGGETGKRTTDVLSIVTQLIALHKSAKSLPTSSVFTLVGP